MKSELKEKIEDLVLEVINISFQDPATKDRGKKYREMKEELFHFIDNNIKE